MFLLPFPKSESGDEDENATLDGSDGDEDSTEGDQQATEATRFFTQEGLGSTRVYA